MYSENKISKIKKRKKTQDDFQVWYHVFDMRTYRTIEKLISNKVIKSIDYPISTGKESDVYRASTYEGAYYAAKIYKITSSSFKNIPFYIFKDKVMQQVKNNRSNFVYQWAKREYKNLTILYENNIPVPKPIKVWKNILLEELLGEEGIAYPIMKNCQCELTKDLWEDLTSTIDKMYNKAKIVHGDLSEYNILMSKEMKYYIIDVGQAMDVDNPSSELYLKKDLTTIGNYFIKKNVIIDIEDAIKHILRR